MLYEDEYTSGTFKIYEKEIKNQPMSKYKSQTVPLNYG